MRPRIRTFKPELFTDEELWDLAIETGYPISQAYMGLWSFADREGRFEWRPRALKAGILPYWDGDMDALLGALVRAGFVARYEVDGRPYGWVPSFVEHQSINAKEPASSLPPPPAPHALPGDDPRVLDACVTRGDGSPPPHVPARAERKGTEGNGSLFVASARDASEGREWEQFPEAFAPSAETLAEAAMQGVTPAELAEHVAYWTVRRFAVPVVDLQGELRRSIPAIRKRRETEQAKAAARAAPGFRGSTLPEGDPWGPLDTRHRQLAEKLGVKDLDSLVSEYRRTAMPRDKSSSDIDKHFSQWLRRRVREAA